MKTTAKISLALILIAALFLVFLRQAPDAPAHPPTVTKVAAIASSDNSPPPLVDLPHSTESDESAALAGFEEMPLTETSWAKEIRSLKELATLAPDAALLRVRGMADKHERKTAAAQICLIVGKNDPAKAITAAWEMELGKFSDEAFENIALETLAKQWADADLGKALLWASKLPADDEARRDRIVKGIALSVARTTPAEAAALVADHIPGDSSVHVDAAMGVLRQWAAQDYNGAIDWAALFPEGPIRDRGIEELAGVGANPPAGQIKPN